MTLNRETPAPALIKASELGEYEFCRRAWWYRHVKNADSASRERLAMGQAHHAQHYAQAQTARRGLWLGALLAGGGLLLLVGALLVSLP